MDKFTNDDWKRLCLGLPINDEALPELAGFYFDVEKEAEKEREDGQAIDNQTSDRDARI